MRIADSVNRENHSGSYRDEPCLEYSTHVWSGLCCMATRATATRDTTGAPESYQEYPDRITSTTWIL